MRFRDYRKAFATEKKHSLLIVAYRCGICCILFMYFCFVNQSINQTHLQNYVGYPCVAVPQRDPQAYGDESAAQGQDDGPEGHQVDHGGVYPRPAVDPQTQRHEHQSQQRGRYGHDDADAGETIKGTDDESPE